MIRIKTPLDSETIDRLQAKDQVSLSGVIFTARDAAHKRMVDSYLAGEALPVDLRGQVIYYVGPCPAKPGKVIGSAGPTTSTRMDPYTPLLLRELGLKGMIGKGNRSKEVVDAIKEQLARDYYRPLNRRIYVGAPVAEVQPVQELPVSSEVSEGPEVDPDTTVTPEKPAGEDNAVGQGDTWDKGTGPLSQ